jgi:hypothetical protein
VAERPGPPERKESAYLYQLLPNVTLISFLSDVNVIVIKFWKI